MRPADRLHFRFWRLLLGEVRNRRALSWTGICLLCLFVGSPCMNWNYQALPLFSLHCCLPWRYKSYVRTWAKTREPLALTLVGKHTRTHKHTHSPYRHSHPSGPRFPVQHLAQTAVCRGEETQSLIRRTRRHSNSDTQRRSTLIKENYLNDTEEDKLQGNVYLYRLL